MGIHKPEEIILLPLVSLSSSALAKSSASERSGSAMSRKEYENADFILI